MLVLAMQFSKERGGQLEGRPPGVRTQGAATNERAGGALQSSRDRSSKQKTGQSSEREPPSGGTTPTTDGA